MKDAGGEVSPGRWLCPACQADSEAGAEVCAKCGADLLVGGEWALVRLLGSGGMGRTFDARSTRTGEEAAVKELSLARIREWKTAELFRRAGTVLAGLSHPGVPRLVRYCEEERGGFTFFYLVQELVPGENLAAGMRRGEPETEAGARSIARSILDILTYLHGASPPVIHRDIKPSNIMRRPDGRLVLIDFDMVRDVVKPAGGSTVSAGTPGFAPLEQYAGRAVAATDIYALGTTLASLLAGKDPIEMMPRGQPRIAFRPHVGVAEGRVSEGFAAILDRMLEPDVRRRFASAAEVLAALDELERAERAGAARPGGKHGAWRVLAAVGRGVRMLLPPSVIVIGIMVIVTPLADWCLPKGISRRIKEMSRGGPRLAAADLSRAQVGGWVELAVPEGMVGGWDTFDVAANAEWLLAIGRRWAPDAGFAKIEAKLADEDGIVDVGWSGDGEVWVTFSSQTRVDGYFEALATRIEPPQWTLLLRLEGHGLWAQPQTSTPESEVAHQLWPGTCWLAQAAAALRRHDIIPAGGPISGTLWTYDGDVKRPLRPIGLPAAERAKVGRVPGSWQIRHPGRQSWTPLVSAATCEPRELR